MKNTTAVLGFLLAAAPLFAAQPVAAQGILVPSTPEQGVWIEAARPDTRFFELSGTSSIWLVSGRIALGERLRVVADVPFTHARLTGGELQPLFGDGSSTVLGNPLLGVEYLATPALRVELAARLPLTTANDTSLADLVGMLGDPHRAEAYARDVVPVTAAVTYGMALEGGLSLRARGGTTTVFRTADEDEASGSDSSLDYGVLGTYTAGAARFGLGVSGRWLATADEGSFRDNSLHQLGASADVSVGGVRPGVLLRVPLDREYREVVRSSVGVYLQIPLR